jgi:germination protein M
MMLGLKEKDNPDVADMTDLTDLEIVEDVIEEDEKEEAVETIIVDTTEKRMKEIVAYYEDEDGYLVPVNTEIPYEEGIAKATLRSLIVGSDIEKKIAQSGLHGVLPEGTEIRGMAIKEGLCRIDLSKQVLNTKSYEQEENMVKAITYTLTEFPTISKVEILVDGQIVVSLPKGYSLDTAFERENINLVGSDDGVNYMVYFKAPDTEVAGYYVPLTFSAKTVENPVVAVVQKLFSGAPKDTELSNKIPYGVSLQGVKISGDTAILNLGIGAVNLSEEEYEDMNEIVVLCIKQFGNIAKVDYTIEGLSFEAAGLKFENNDVVPVFNQY